MRQRGWDVRNGDAARDIADRPGVSGDAAAEALKYGIGQPVSRNEDPTLVQGQGQYTDDLAVPGQVYAVMVRSPIAHGAINGIDTEAAKAMPGVLGVYTAADLSEYGEFGNGMNAKSRDGSPMVKAPRTVLATDKVRYVGQPLAFVVAETANAARDAAEAVMPDIATLPAAVTAADASAPDAPQLYAEAPGNLMIDYHSGDTDAATAAFAAAAHTTKIDIVSQRLVVNPLEPRAAIGEYDAANEHFTLHVGTQGVFGMRASMAEPVLKVPLEKLRILTRQVGGSFGMKSSPFPEYICLLHAARDLGRPVKWTDQRSESFMSDHHGRGLHATAELALDAEGRFLAVRIIGLADMGAECTPVAPIFAAINVHRNAVGTYRTPVIQTDIKCLYTNATPMSAYRGAGRPEGNYIMERLIETAAREMGLDAVALRRLNHIQPDDLPYETPGDSTYDSGEFTALLDRTLMKADWDGFPARKAESVSRGKLRGRGIGQYLEITAPPMNEMGGIRFEEDGTVTIVTGTLDYGQGHWTPFAQVLSARLGVPFAAIRLVQGDSDQLIAGGGTGGSKSLMASGSAIMEASEIVIENGRKIAAELLEAGVADIEFKDGQFGIVGTDRTIGIMDLARTLREGHARLAPETPRSLDVKHIFKSAPSAYPNGCHVAEVEIDPETGVTEVVSYTTVNDFGTIVNPMLVEGQLHGGVVQGIGQALMEHTAYDSEGQLISGSFMDYQLPRANDLPTFSPFDSRPVPAKTNVLGVKGCGEAGVAGALPSVMNAVVDALHEYGIVNIDMPATPERVWRAIRDAKAA